MIKFVGNEASVQAWLDAEASLVDPVPEGWITVEQYSKMINRSVRAAGVRLVKLVNAGLAKRQPWPVPTAGGKMYIYALTNAPKRAA